MRLVVATVPVAGRRLRRGTGSPPVGWPDGFTPLDSLVAPDDNSAADLAVGTFRFLGDKCDLGVPPRWDAPGTSRLWRFHLHYFEWAWQLAAMEDRDAARGHFARLWSSWSSANALFVGDAWSPYVASLRAWALCGVHASLVAATPIEPEVDAALATHARYVRTFLERDIGGNHLLKNLKALAGLGVFLDDRQLTDWAVGRLADQCDRQVLADGGHVERSPSYHCQVLGDLLDVQHLLTATGVPVPVRIEDAVGAMQRWLATMLMPDGDVPLFNDCTLVGADRIGILRGDAGPGDAVEVLQPSGYVVVRLGRAHLVADVGPPCPPDLPAHAHADCLSFELAVDGRRIVVDAGTSTYEPGDRRVHERSTAAHNTVEVDRADQTEVWGAFRAARLAMPRLEGVGAAEDGDTVEVTASHDGYERLPGRPRHRRSWRIGRERLEIVDEVTGGGRHEVVARLHLAHVLATGAATATTADAVEVAGIEIRTAGGAVRLRGPGSDDRAWVATGFARREPAAVLEVVAWGPLPILMATTIDWSAAPTPAPTLDRS